MQIDHAMNYPAYLDYLNVKLNHSQQDTIWEHAEETNSAVWAVLLVILLALFILYGCARGAAPF